MSVKSFNQNLSYVFLVVDNEGDVGEMSNVVKAYMPRPLVIGQSGSNNTPLREGLFDPLRTPSEPNVVIMYVIVGIVSVVIFTFFVIVLVIILLRKKSTCDTVISSMDVREHNTSLKKNSFPDENDKKGWECNHLENQLNIYNSLRRQHKEDFSQTISNREEYFSTGSLARLTNEKSQEQNFDIFDYLPSTKDFQIHEDTYIRGYQPSPTYAKPVPKSMRTNLKKDEKLPKVNGNVYSDQSLLRIHREEGDGEPAESGNKEQLYTGSVNQIETEYCRISTLKKVAPPTLPKPITMVDVTQNCQPNNLVTTLDIVPTSANIYAEADKRVQNSTIV